MNAVKAEIKGPIRHKAPRCASLFSRALFHVAAIIMRLGTDRFIVLFNSVSESNKVSPPFNRQVPHQRDRSKCLVNGRICSLVIVLRSHRHRVPKLFITILRRWVIQDRIHRSTDLAPIDIKFCDRIVKRERELSIVYLTLFRDLLSQNL